uniref:Nucleocapsid n=1 Tax=Bremia lactucae associated yuevirus-like virus 1 TaxID=2719814 RepID=A0A6G9EN32_9VIRU|nr:MAG: nucleocapsid [Bremia lactucae associated yuevirus-like virus 1]
MSFVTQVSQSDLEQKAAPESVAQVMPTAQLAAVAAPKNQTPPMAQVQAATVPPVPPLPPSNPGSGPNPGPPVPPGGGSGPGPNPPPGGGGGGGGNPPNVPPAGGSTPRPPATPITLAWLGHGDSRAMPFVSTLVHHHFSNRFLTANDLEETQTGAFMFIMVHTLAGLLGTVLLSISAGNAPNAQTGADLAGDPSAPLTICNGTTAIQQARHLQNSGLSEEMKNWGRVVLTSVDNVKALFRELLAAHQTGKLNERNFESFFAMKGMNPLRWSPVKKLLDLAAQHSEKIYERNRQNAAFTMVPWHEYRQSASSTPSLVDKMINDLGIHARTFLSQADIDLVRAARAAPWDLNAAKAIPTRVVALTHAFLKSQKSLPDGWYQGDKAKDGFSASSYKAAIAVFSKFGDLSMNSTAVDSAADIAALIAAIPGFMRAT